MAYRGKRQRAAVLVTGMFAVSLALAGCGTGEDAEQTPPDEVAGSALPGEQPPSAEQKAALADGVVTRDEYETAFRSYRSCVEGTGQTLVVTDMDAEIIDYYQALGDEEAERGCYTMHFMEVDIEWQLAHEDLRPDIEFYANCLQEHGIEPTTEGPDPLPGVDHQPRLNALSSQIAAAGLEETCAPPMGEVPTDIPIDPAYGSADDVQ